jgi:hypothetical protein
MTPAAIIALLRHVKRQKNHKEAWFDNHR